MAHSLENIVEAEAIVWNSDFHGNYNIIRNGLAYAAANDAVYGVNGDIVNDYQLKKYARDLGILSPYDMQLEYFNEHLSKQDMEALLVSQNASKYGVEAFLEQVPEDKKEQFRKNLESVIEYSKSDLFRGRIERVSDQMITEKGGEIQKNALKFRALYEVFMDEEAKRFAEELNNYSNVTVFFNKGNHENVFFVEQIRQYLDNKDQIIDLAEQDKCYKIRNSQNVDLTLVGMTNCAQFMPYLHEIFSSEEIGFLYSHTAREKQIDLDEDLDLFISHGQVGKPMGLANAFEVPYLDSAKKLSLEAKLTVEGHIHNKYDGKNSFGKDMVRVAGEEAVVIRKDAKGRLHKEWVRLGSDYNGGHTNPIPYDKDYMIRRVEDVFKQYMEMEIGMDDDVENFAKAV